MTCSTAIFHAALADLATIAAGYPLRGAVDALPEGDVAVIQMGDVSADDGIDWPNVSRVTLPRSRDESYLRKGDVIFTTRGARNFALAIDDIQGQAVCSPHFFVIRIMPQCNLLPEFLAWQINQRPVQEYFQREATGSFILNIRRDVMEATPIAFPDLAKQHSIVALADTALAESAALKKLIKNRHDGLEAIAMDLYRDLHAPIKELAL
jgi:restriction endonuclease S subunit